MNSSEDKDSDGKEKKSKSKEKDKDKDKKKEPASMFQISGGKETKSKKKGDSLQKDFVFEAPPSPMCNFVLDESFHPPASVCSSQIGQWRQRGGDKIKQVKEEVHSCSSVHVPNIWRQGQGEREEKEKRQVHLWAGSPDEPLEGLQPFVSFLPVFLAKQDDSEDSESEKEEKTKKKKGKGKKKKVQEQKPAASCRNQVLVSSRQLMQYIYLARRGPRRLRSSLTTWRSSCWSRLPRALRSSAGWPETREGWTRTSTLSTTFTWTTTKRSGHCLVSLWVTGRRSHLS